MSTAAKETEKKGTIEKDGTVPDTFQVHVI